MRVLFDYQAFITPVCGISRYHVELIKNFSEDIIAMFPFMFGDNLCLNEIGVQHCSFLNHKHLSFKYNLYKALDIGLSRLAMSKNNFDIFHPTSMNPYFLDHSKKPLVLTVHDLNFSRFGDLLPNASSVQNKYRLCCAKADHLIAISEETKLDLMKYFNVPDNKITVIYHGVDQSLIKCGSNPIYKNPYILYIGGRDTYKNFANFLQAFSMIDENIELVCTSYSFNNYERELINKLNLSNRIHQKFATDEDLNNLLCHALAFIYPSLGEGFGLPILEAYRCGCPCIISDIMCFHEVAGDAAVYFNQKSVDDMATVINRTISDCAMLTRMKELGYNRMKLFTWKKTAFQTESVYKNVLQ